MGQSKQVQTSLGHKPRPCPPETTTVMSSTKAPTSLLSGTSSFGTQAVLVDDHPVLLTIGFELLTKRVWCRSLVGIRRIHFTGLPPEIPNTRLSSTTKLPLEIVQMMVAYLIYDRSSLLACSLTCYSWYIAAAPHLHHTLITTTCSWCPSQRLRWPKPLWKAHRLGLLPLVRKLQLHAGPRHNESGISPKQFDCRIIRRWFGLINVQELGIDNLEIPKFIPRIRQFFGHFLLTVRSLALRDPRGSHHQVLYFIGLFQHLEDLKLLYDSVKFRGNQQTTWHSFHPPSLHCKGG